jgi:dienelactone hydrolase
MGWSHGGTTVLTAVAEPLPPGLIQAAVAFYPGCAEVGRYPGWRPGVPLLMLLGSIDNWTPPADCRALAAQYPGVIEVATYAGANHGFDSPGNPIRTQTLPNGRMVTTGTDAAGRAASLDRVAGFLAAHGGSAR